MEKRGYNSDAYWRSYYLKLLREFAARNNELMNEVVNLRKSNKKLRRENARLRHAKKQSKPNLRK